MVDIQCFVCGHARPFCGYRGLLCGNPGLFRILVKETCVCVCVCVCVLIRSCVLCVFLSVCVCDSLADMQGPFVDMQGSSHLQQNCIRIFMNIYTQIRKYIYTHIYLHIYMRAHRDSIKDTRLFFTQ